MELFQFQAATSARPADHWAGGLPGQLAYALKRRRGATTARKRRCDGGTRAHFRGDIPMADTIQPTLRMEKRALNRGKAGSPGRRPRLLQVVRARLPRTCDTAKRAGMSRFSIKLTMARIIGPVA